MKPTPLYPSHTYKTSKSPKHLAGLAVYASTTLGRAIGTIEAAELDSPHASREVCSAMSASDSAKSAASALLNLSAVHNNRAGGPTYTGEALERSAEQIWTLAARQAVEDEPSATWEALRGELSDAVGLTLTALELNASRDLK